MELLHKMGVKNDQDCVQTLVITTYKLCVNTLLLMAVAVGAVWHKVKNDQDCVQILVITTYNLCVTTLLLIAVAARAVWH